MSLKQELPSAVLITKQNQLDEFVESCKNCKVLALDTEFVRTRSYYAKLGLIQVFDGNTLALIDPITELNLTDFWSLLVDESIIKLLHSASEDLEIFAHYGKVQPVPYFDSQIAASLIGMGHGLGYAKLIETCLGITLDKGESRTDWIKRPLSDKQLHYAANDVFYLYHVFSYLETRLREINRLEWLYEEGEFLCKGRLEEIDYENAYLKVKNGFQLQRMQLAYLKPLATWRLKTAVKRDLALGFVVKDHALIAISKRAPQNLSDLSNIRELLDSEKRKHGHAIVECMINADIEQLPQAIDVIAFRPDYKSCFKLIKAALSQISEDHNIPMEFIGSKRYIHQYLNWLWSDKKHEKPRVLTGWRQEVIEPRLSQIQF
ncbi:ribonuclease D [Parashewanella spongiae]|uniref:ribonuclease D n=1 Tax=Parashewanella spongiae TaxID=342950 RepID=UPI0035D676AB